jgi:hypothetical protein
MDATNVTGRAARPTASCSERPLWRRSSAALSNAHRREKRALLRIGSTGNRFASPSSVENSSNVRNPAQPGELIPAGKELDLADLVPRDVLALAVVASPLSRKTIEIFVTTGASRTRLRRR